MSQPSTIIRHCPARIGLLGNPSDGYNGKTISLSLQNFSASVTLQPSTQLQICPHLRHDSLRYESLEGLARHVSSHGYYGGARLLLATCKRLADYCGERAIPLHGGNYALSYETNIPRQTGLSGSSAIVCAALSCLMAHYNIEDRVPPLERPALVLSVEAELGITAGLQDRVIQVFGGLVCMDFDKASMQAQGHGRYEALDPALLPELHLVYASSASDSGAVHSDVRQRWLAGDEGVRESMAEIAALVDPGRDALQNRDYDCLGGLMSRNFDLRRQIFGDAVLGATNLRMVELVREAGGHGKFTGSGGAIVAYFPDGEGQMLHARRLCEEAGFSMEQVRVAPAVLQIPGLD